MSLHGVLSKLNSDYETIFGKQTSIRSTAETSGKKSSRSIEASKEKVTELSQKFFLVQETDPLTSETVLRFKKKPWGWWIIRSIRKLLHIAPRKEYLLSDNLTLLKQALEKTTIEDKQEFISVIKIVCAVDKMKKHYEEQNTSSKVLKQNLAWNVEVITKTVYEKIENTQDIEVAVKPVVEELLGTQVADSLTANISFVPKPEIPLENAFPEENNENSTLVPEVDSAQNFSTPQRPPKVRSLLSGVKTNKRQAALEAARKAAEIILKKPQVRENTSSATKKIQSKKGAATTPRPNDSNTLPSPRTPVSAAHVNESFISPTTTARIGSISERIASARKGKRNLTSEQIDAIIESNRRDKTPPDKGINHTYLAERARSALAKKKSGPAHVQKNSTTKTADQEALHNQFLTWFKENFNESLTLSCLKGNLKDLEVVSSTKAILENLFFIQLIGSFIQQAKDSQSPEIFGKSQNLTQFQQIEQLYNNSILEGLDAEIETYFKEVFRPFLHAKSMCKSDDTLANVVSLLAGVNINTTSISTLFDLYILHVFCMLISSHIKYNDYGNKLYSMMHVAKSKVYLNSGFVALIDNIPQYLLKNFYDKLSHPSLTITVNDSTSETLNKISEAFHRKTQASARNKKEIVSFKKKKFVDVEIKTILESITSIIRQPELLTEDIIDGIDTIFDELAHTDIVIEIKAELEKLLVQPKLPELDQQQKQFFTALYSAKDMRGYIQQAGGVDSEKGRTLLINLMDFCNVCIKHLVHIAVNQQKVKSTDFLQAHSRVLFFKRLIRTFPILENFTSINNRTKFISIFANRQDLSMQLEKFLSKEDYEEFIEILETEERLQEKQIQLQNRAATLEQKINDPSHKTVCKNIAAALFKEIALYSIYISPRAIMNMTDNLIQEKNKGYIHQYISEEVVPFNNANSHVQWAEDVERTLDIYDGCMDVIELLDEDEDISQVTTEALKELENIYQSINNLPSALTESFANTLRVINESWYVPTGIDVGDALTDTHHVKTSYFRKLLEKLSTVDSLYINEYTDILTQFSRGAKQYIRSLQEISKAIAGYTQVQQRMQSEHLDEESAQLAELEKEQKMKVSTAIDNLKLELDNINALYMRVNVLEKASEHQAETVRKYANEIENIFAINNIELLKALSASVFLTPIRSIQEYEAEKIEPSYQQFTAIIQTHKRSIVGDQRVKVPESLEARIRYMREHSSDARNPDGLGKAFAKVITQQDSSSDEEGDDNDDDWK